MACPDIGGIGGIGGIARIGDVRSIAGTGGTVDVWSIAGTGGMGILGGMAGMGGIAYMGMSDDPLHPAGLFVMICFRPSKTTANNTMTPVITTGKRISFRCPIGEFTSCG